MLKDSIESFTSFIPAQFDVKWNGNNAYIWINVSMGTAYVEFSEQDIVAVVENGVSCHIWEIFPTQKDFQSAIHKISNLSGWN